MGFDFQLAALRNGFGFDLRGFPDLQGERVFACNFDGFAVADLAAGGGGVDCFRDGFCLAGGICDDMLTTTYLASKAPKIICPAMNTAMYEDAVFQKRRGLTR